MSPRDRLFAVLGRVSAATRTRSFRIGFGLLLAALAIWALLSERHQVADAVSELTPGWLVLAAAATVVNVTMAGMVWRTVLADLGSKLPLRVAARIFFVGQLGKYLPGSVWPVVMQTELGHDHKVPRKRTATATMVAMLLSVTSALLVMLAALPFAPDALPRGFRWAVLLVLPLVVVLHPGVLGWLVDLALRLLGRGRLDQRTSVRGTLAATGWAIGSWAGAGLQVWALSVPLGADANVKTLLLLIGGYSLAWAVGFVVIIAPAGAGVREVALLAVLSTVLDRGPALVVVLLSRVLFTIVDLGAAGLGLYAGHHHGSQEAGRTAGSSGGGVAGSAGGSAATGAPQAGTTGRTRGTNDRPADRPAARPAQRPDLRTAQEATGPELPLGQE